MYEKILQNTTKILETFYMNNNNNNKGKQINIYIDRYAYTIYQ